MTPMQRAWTFAGFVAFSMVVLIGCSAMDQERQSIEWANVSHALQCETGGLC